MNKVLSDTLEANICHHCINSCVSCSHFSPINKPYFVTPESLKKDLRDMSKIFHSERFVILGGEPLLHPQILEMIDIAKESGVSDTVEVLTNGTILGRQTDEFWEKVQAVRISLYEGKLSQAQIAGFHATAQKHGRFLEILPQKRFLKVWYKKPFEGEAIRENFRTCEYRQRCFTIQDGYFFLCPQSWQIPNIFRGQPFNTEGFKVDGKTADELWSFIKREEPFKSCDICANGWSPTSKWSDWRECDRKEWLDESAIW